MRSRLVRAMSWSCLGVLLGSCGDDPAGPSGPASVRIVTRQPTLTALGDSVVMSAAVEDHDGTPVDGIRVSWSTTSTSVASVSAAGAVVARSVGTALIRASAGSLTDTTTVTVTQEAGVLEIVVRQPTLTALGDSLPLAVVVSDRNGNRIPDAPITWESAAIDRVEITSEGIAIARANGTSTITARAGNANDTTTVIVAQRVAQMRFVTRPGRQLASRSLEPRIEVALEDARGAPVTAPTEPVRLSLAPSGTLSGTTSVTPSDGVAAFTGVQIDQPGAAYRLVAEMDGVPSVMSIFFAAHIPLVEVSAGHVHTCGVTADGTAYCWGSNSTGRLGDETSTDRDAPVRVTGDQHFVAIDAGGPATWALTVGGIPFGWGQSLGTSPVALPVPQIFGFLETRWHSCGLTTEGRAYCWGTATSAFGAGDSDGAPVAEPTLAMGGGSYTTIGTGSYSTCALAPDGAAWCAGQNYYSELGDGTTEFSSAPTAVVGGLHFTELAVGDSFACAIATDGLTYCWGRNDRQQLGDPEAGDQSSFPLAVVGGHRFTSISLGMHHACGLKADGTAYCWGDGSSGALGSGGYVPSQPVPVAVTGGQQFRSVSAGGYHTCGIAHDGYTYCWGSNINGELGTGGGASQPVPTLVAAPEP